MCSSDFEQVSETDFKKISSSVSKIGYVDGLSAGKDSSFQLGFDQGYADGLKTGLEITKWKTLITNSTKDRDFQSENILQSATEKCHFQMLKSIDKPTQEISKIQNEYVDDLVQKLKIKFPKISNMLYYKE